MRLQKPSRTMFFMFYFVPQDGLDASKLAGLDEHEVRRVMLKHLRDCLDEIVADDDQEDDDFSEEDVSKEIAGDHDKESTVTHLERCLDL